MTGSPPSVGMLPIGSILPLFPFSSLLSPFPPVMRRCLIGENSGSREIGSEGGEAGRERRGGSVRCAVCGQLIALVTTGKRKEGTVCM